MTSAPVRFDPATVYPRVQQFYAAQMQRLDARDLTGYADTFTVDAEFAHTPGRPPARTRAGIVADLVDFHRKFEDDPMQRRHLVSMINISPRDGGGLTSTAYCLVVKIRPGSEPVLVSCVLHDVLFETEGELLTHSRQVTYD
ncbi:actinorhodin biosynthesis protein ActVIA [Frankia sp. EI5c]|uniref:nuclear transport factor 2 family protein n=1 Tax=Frankia sp. EI5c TaxID=683316 RepID=UPI0007C332A2|nr:nuclear transport factor 2 family protein [Frankia sp. EI5c]OAA28777.1 actinorhodin biosynthesis protein ActVIA [Frankia sp. EI5c]